jgi:hypothetical protein
MIVGPAPVPAPLRALPGLPPSCGRTRLVAVDGHAGSGKSTFATWLAEALGGVPVLRLDDLATHREPFGWSGRLHEQVVGPLARGEAARYAPYDWTRRRFGEPRELCPAGAPLVLVEGVGAARREVRPWLARVLWMEVPRAEAWARGRRRDGPGLAAFWDEWEGAERAHFGRDPSRPHADLLVQQCPVGYQVLPGPTGTE